VGAIEDTYSSDVQIGELNWLAPRPSAGSRVLVQIRHRASAAAATVATVNADEIALRFEKPQRSVAPGQSAVLFDGEIVLGGGRIQMR
jgi:tRNA-specific 2-thiouridylase